MTPIRATWSSFFGSRNSRFESQFRTKNTIYTIWYTVYMQPKKQLKVQYISIFEEVDSFYWTKMHFLKKGPKIRAWVDPPPPHSGNARNKTFFLYWCLPLVGIFRSDNIKVCSFTCLPTLLEVLSFSSQRPSYGSRIGSTGNLAGGYVFVSVASLLDSTVTRVRPRIGK